MYLKIGILSVDGQIVVWKQNPLLEVLRSLHLDAKTISETLIFETQWSAFRFDEKKMCVSWIKWYYDALKKIYWCKGMYSFLRHC